MCKPASAIASASRAEIFAQAEQLHFGRSSRGAILTQAELLHFHAG